MLNYFDYSLIPQNAIESLKLYVDKHIQPGEFLMAVLENDLTMAVRLADLHNTAIIYSFNASTIEIIPTYANYIYNELPMNCWGSKEKVMKWLNNNEEAKND